MSSRIATIVLIILALNTVWFVLYALDLGLRGLAAGAPSQVSRAYADGAWLSNGALALHMICGAVISIGAPLQALPILRRRWPRLHRRAGYGLLALAVLTGLGGAVYIALRGTIGGWWMSLWFGLYGAALVWSAANAVYAALNKAFERHMEWAVRFIVLAVGSWIYRMHYVIWYSLTDGLGSNRAFEGPFDLIQVFAFYVPYLVIAEIVLRRRRAHPAPLTAP